MRIQMQSCLVMCALVARLCRLLRPAKTHLFTLLSQLDPIEVSIFPGPRPDPKHHYGIALAIVAFALIYGVFGFHLESSTFISGDLSMTDLATSLRTSPYIVSHQVVPRSIWPQMDVAFSLDICSLICVCIVLLTRRQLDAKFQMKLSSGDEIDKQQIVIGSKGMNL